MPTKLNLAISARELKETKKQGGISGKLAAFAIGFLEKYFGTSLLLKIPSGLEDTEPELFGAIKTAEKLQDLGIIEKIKRRPKYPDEPHLFWVSITNQNLRDVGSGVDFFSEKAAFWKAIGESAERSLWRADNDIFKNVLVLPYEKIKDQALNIFKLAGFSEEQKKSNPRLNFNENTPFGWITATSLTSQKGNKKIFCPAQLVNSHYFREKVTNPETKKEPMLRQIITTGVATGGNLEEALAKGILEIIERDAYIISYLNKISPPVIDFEYLSFQNEKLEKVFQMFKRYNLEVYLIKLPTDFSVLAVSAVILDKSGKGPAFTIGNSADFNLEDAVLSALSEALAIRLSLKKNWESKKEMDFPDPGKFKQIDRMIYWANPENASRLDFMIRGKKIRIDLSQEANFFESAEKEKNRKYYQKKLQELIHELREKSYEACYFELSNDGVRKVGLRSVQVVIPELQPIHLDEETPCLGGRRLKELPKKNGYTPAENLNQEPHPFG